MGLSKQVDNPIFYYLPINLIMVPDHILSLPRDCIARCAIWLVSIP